MRNNLEITEGMVFSQAVLLALIAKGKSRQEAYSHCPSACIAFTAMGLTRNNHLKNC